MYKKIIAILFTVTLAVSPIGHVHAAEVPAREIENEVINETVISEDGTEEDEEPINKQEPQTEEEENITGDNSRCEDDEVSAAPETADTEIAGNAREGINEDTTLNEVPNGKTDAEEDADCGKQQENTDEGSVSADAADDESADELPHEFSDGAEDAPSEDDTQMSVINEDGQTSPSDTEIMFEGNIGPVQRGVEEKADSAYESTQTSETASEYEEGVTTINGAKYLIGADGKPVTETGWYTLDGKTYYLDEGGKIRTSALVRVGDDVYYVDENGERATGWKTVNGKKRYFNPKSGVMKKGFATINGKKYYFWINGNLQTNGTVQSGESVYKANSDGTLTFLKKAPIKNGWKNEESNRFYYVNGERVKGVKKIDGKLFLFNADGKLVKNTWVTIDGKTYHSDGEGLVQTGIKRINNAVYYFTNAGVRATGWRAANGKRFYFNSDGVRAYGWKTVNGKKYYLTPQMVTGANKIGGNWYYFGSNGVMQTGKVQRDGNTYFYDGSGKLQTGTVVIDGITYNTGSSGIITNGIKEENGNIYIYNENQELITIGTPVVDGITYQVNEDGIATVHEHDWEPITKTVHHDATGHYETRSKTTKVVDEEAWDETVYDTICRCTKCGATFTDVEDMGDHLDDAHDGDASYSVHEVEVDTIHHPEVSHEETETWEEWVDDSWDEEVTTGYRCTGCGATR